MPSTHHHPKPTDPLQKRVDDLIHRYRSPQGPSSVLLEVSNDPESYGTLVSALRRQTSLAKCRSQELEDCQVTVYDKALLALSNYGESATDPGALELYLTEFLGVVPISPVADGKDVVGKHVDLQNVLHRVESHEVEPVSAPSKKVKREREATSSPFDIEEYERNYSEPRLYHDDEDTKSQQYQQTTAFVRPAHSQRNKPDVRVARLLEVYNQAKEDYFTTKKRDGVEDLTALRFLRDSAENTLRYLHANGMSDNIYIPDLEHTFAIARDKTAQILGGRNRYFDEAAKHESVRYESLRYETPKYPARYEATKGKRCRTSSVGKKRHGSRRLVDSYRPQAHQ